MESGSCSFGISEKRIFGTVRRIQLAVKGNTSSFNIPAGWALMSNSGS
jgi:hypothetical protein